MAEQPAAWGVLSLHSWEPRGQHPLAPEQPKSVRLCGDADLVIGRSSTSILRLHKSLVWASNKHFTLALQAQAGGGVVRDCSSNGTWINGERLDKQHPRPLRSGDLVELAAEEGTEHRQVTFTFEALPAGGASQKRPLADVSGDSQVPGSAGSTASHTRAKVAAAAVTPGPPGDAHAIAAAPAAEPRPADPSPVAASAEPTSRAVVVNEEARRQAEVSLLRAELARAEAAAEEGRTTTVNFEGAAAAAAAAAEEQEVRARLVARVSESEQQLQRAMQEQAGQVAAREAAEEEARRQAAAAEAANCRLADVEAELTALRAREAAASQEARTERAAAGALRAALSAMRTGIDDALAKEVSPSSYF